MILLLIVLLCFFHQNMSANNHELLDHEVWWQKSLNQKMSTFGGWLGDVEAPSRIAARSYIKNMMYSSILDAACGLCTEFYGYQKETIYIEYKGLDVTPLLVERARGLNIDVDQGSIEEIPYEDSSFDVCYGRHILEHLAYYDKAIDELIRVAKKEVLIVFFLRPEEIKHDYICCELVDGQFLFHNWYNKKKFENYVKSNNKVLQMKWAIINDQEVMAHIYLK